MDISKKDKALCMLGSNIRSRRKEIGLSQEDLANTCGFDRTYISLIERGKRNVSFSNLLILASGLRTDVSTLTRGILWH